jgi:hypothetical protein
MNFRGRAVVTATLMGSGLGAAVAVLLRSGVSNTPVEVNPRTFFWWLVLLSGAGALAGMALESVRQLQMASPEPDYRRRSLRAGITPDPAARPEPGPHRDEADS